MRDGDGDGKCQEEDGKWVPCPPGVSNGSVIDAAGRALRPIGEPIGERQSADNPLTQLAKTREKAKKKAEAITKAAQEGVTREQRAYAKKILKILKKLENASDRDDYMYYKREARTAIASMFSHEIEGLDGKKYKVEIDELDIEIQPGDSFSFYGQIHDADGQKVGSFNRSFSLWESTVNHDEFKIDNKHRKNGLGSAMNARNEILYRDMGFKAIYVDGLSGSGSGSIGATHWPKNGFDWADEMNKRDFISTIKAAIARYKRGESDQDKALFDSKEQAEYIAALIDQAQTELLSDEDRITAGDLLNWPGAESWFQRSASIILYKKELV